MKPLNRHSGNGQIARPQSRGSAIVLAILAIAVVSMASITIVRSHRRANFRQSAVQARTQGRLIADGLVHREIAFHRLSPTSRLAPPDKSLAALPAFANAQAISTNINATSETMDATVTLYPGAPAATVRQRIDISPSR